MTFDQMLAVLAARAAAEAEAAASAYEQALLDRAAFVGTTAARIAYANARAVAAADVYLAAWATLRTGVNAGPLGLAPPDSDTARLVRAMLTIATATEAADHALGGLRARTERLARTEPMTAGRQAYQQAMRARGVTSWRRIVHPQACDTCAQLVGQVEPIEVSFLDHPNCRCSLAPSVPATWGERVRTEQFQLRTATPAGVRLSFGTEIKTTREPV